MQYQVERTLSVTICLQLSTCLMLLNFLRCGAIRNSMM